MSAFEKLQSFLDELEATKWQLTDQKNGMVMQRAAKAQEIDEALLTGDGAEIQSALDTLDGETATLEQRIKVIDDTLEGRRKSPQLGTLAAAAVAETRERIGALQQDWDGLASKLADLDAARLALVGRLGEIDREAQRLTSRAIQANDKTLPPRTAAPSLNTGVIITRNRQSGPIFPNLAGIEKVFKGA
jgi:DNA repair exonuclease SbcCD ATPase subunit